MLKGYRRKDKRRIYWETKCGFVLYCDGVPIASIGFDKEEDHLFIRQVQDVRGSQEHMAPLRWERFLWMRSFSRYACKFRRPPHKGRPLSFP